jgi:hypothetical protein
LRTAPGQYLWPSLCSFLINCLKKQSASDPEQVLEVAKQIERSGVIVAVGYMLRYSAAFEKAKQLLSRFAI